MKSVRLDKYLADMGIGTRSEVKNFVRKGRVTVNGEIMKSPECKIGIGSDQVSVDGKALEYITLEYYMLNKPAGVISATNDSKETTVIDLIEEAKRKDLFPVGRLDKDTEGLLLITNDGELAHRLLSPKKHVVKVYFAIVVGQVTNSDVDLFASGMAVDDEFTAMPASLKILNVMHEDEEVISEIELTIREGKFHQVKRMFESINKPVVYLKRLSMGSLKLDNQLELGDYRKLTELELEELRK